MAYNSKLFVIIDPGHGGNDSGASGNGLIEKNVNLVTALALRDALKKEGIKVAILRTSDTRMDLYNRTNTANKLAKNNPNLYSIYISIHHNAGGGDRGEYIYSINGGQSKKIAEAIGNEMLTQNGQQKKSYSKKGNNGRDYYHVIRETTMASVIVEVAFLDNAADVKICNTIDKQKKNGEIIAAGVIRWGVKEGYLENVVPSRTYSVETKQLNDHNGEGETFTAIDNYLGKNYFKYLKRITIKKKGNFICYVFSKLSKEEANDIKEKLAGFFDKMY